MCRFGLFVEGLKRAIAERIDGRDHAGLGPAGLLLWSYLGRILRRLSALHARFEAGTLDAARCRPAATRPASDPASERPAPERLRLRILPAALARHGMGYFYARLLPLVEDPEMRSLLAAAPQAGRLLRPLWRMLTSDPLPEPLRLPPSPQKPPPELSPEPPALAPPRERPPPGSRSRLRRAGLGRPRPFRAFCPPPLLPA